MQAARATIESLFVILELRHDVVAAIGLQQPPNRAVREPPPNLHQLVANTPLAVLGARPTAFFQCSLRFADGAKSQLLISHCCLPKMARGASRWKNQVGIEVIQSIFVSIPGSKCGTNVSQPSECGHDCLSAVIRSSSSRFRSGGRSRHRVLGTAEHRGQLPGGSVRRVLAGRPTTREWNSRHPATALGANSGLMRRKNANKLLPLHSITSSARASTVEGISRPRAFAALRLTTSTYLVGA